MWLTPCLGYVHNRRSRIHYNLNQEHESIMEIQSLTLVSVSLDYDNSSQALLSLSNMEEDLLTLVDDPSKIAHKHAPIEEP